MCAQNVTEIYLIRHGETDWNKEGRLQGHTDIGLNETGRSQAMHLGELLADIPFASAFSSDLSRATQTAELILASRNIPVVSAVALRERSGGALEGLSFYEFDQHVRPFFLSKKALDKETYMQSSWHPELETLHSVFERVKSFVLHNIKKPVGLPVLIVSHGGVLRSFLDHFSFTPKQRWIVSNCGFIKMTIDKDSLHLIDSHGVIRKEIA